MQETWVRSLGWEDPLEEGMATHSSILAWGLPWTEEPGGLQSVTEATKARTEGASASVLGLKAGLAAWASLLPPTSHVNLGNAAPFLCASVSSSLERG